MRCDELKSSKLSESCTFLIKRSALHDFLNISRTYKMNLLLYGCETWVAHVKGKCRGHLRTLFGPRHKEPTRVGWRKLHNEKLHDVYSSTIVLKGKGKAVPQHIYRGAGGRGGIAPTHS
jgi:hypothetical protein